jgi:hypothetical protein
MNRRLSLTALALVLVAAGCGSSAKPDITVGTKKADTSLSAEVASYDLVANRAGRFLVGVFANDNEHLLGYGNVQFRFTYLGTKAAALTEPRPSMTTTAGFLPIPGQELRSATTPRLVAASQAIGVYGAPSVTFDEPGFWQVNISAATATKTLGAEASFEVDATSPLPGPGAPAPASRQPLAGTPGVSPTAIDSRAGGGEPVPDPELHNITIADALAAHRPMMIVISTPTYCQSRFCGPITDAVAALAKKHPGPIAFIHLEIWKDFDKGLVNDAAAQWIVPPGTTDAREPWVFTVGGDGIIRQRFDNVASEKELAAAVNDLLAS